MNEKKFCFITCVNNQDYYRESLEYIYNLDVPEGYEVEVLSIENSKSITAGYNEGMKSSDAKYKIYLHQDTFIINKNFLLDILVHFKSDSSVGMIGMIGCKKIPVKGIWWESSSTIGEVYESSTDYCKLLRLNNIEGRYEEAEGIDGFLMVTQYDLPWREDIFNGWHFYDLSQVMEFKRNGYKTIIPKQHEPLCVHDCGIVNTVNGYDEYRKKFIKEYSKDLFPLVSILIPTYNRPKYLLLALESAINQSYCNIEIIIGDDSNNNDSEKLIKKYLDKYKNIRYYHNEKNLGQFDNDLKLLDMANGRYINFLMDDDLFELTKIEKMMEYFINDKEDQISLVTSNSKLIDEYGNFKTNYILDESIELVGDKIWNGKELTEMTLAQNKNIIGEPSTVLFDKNKLTEGFGYYKGRKCICNVDQGTWYNLLSNGKGVVIKESLSSFRQHNDQQLNIEKNIIGGVQDYTYMILNARENGLFKDEIDYSKAIKNCYDYAKSIRNKYSNDKNLMRCIDDLKGKYEEIKNNLPLVSILIPTYNRPEYLKIALDSAVNQTYPNIEIIIGDNSENDITENMIYENYSHYKSIRYFNNDGNIGSSKNVENLFDKMSGEYLNVLMDDDVLDHSKIEKMIRYYLGNKDVTLVTSYRKLIDGNGNELPDCNFNKCLFQSDVILNGKDVGHEILMSLTNFIGEPSTVLIKVDILENKGKYKAIEGFGRYKEKLYKPNGDIAMWLTCCSLGKIIYIVEPLSYFRIHSGQEQKNIKTQIIGVKELNTLIKDSYIDGYLIKNKNDYLSSLNLWLIIANSLVSNINKQEDFKYAEELIEMIESAKSEINK